jgi:hypothetical protein
MAGSGIVNSVTFTPDAAGQVIVTATFSAAGNGSDWGSARWYKCFLTQDGSTTYGDQLPVSTTRVAFTARYAFSVVAGLPVQCGLYGGVNGAAAISFYDTQVLAELIKR